MFILFVIGIIIVGFYLFVVLGVDAGEMAGGCLGGVLELVILIAVVGFCFTIHPLLGTIVLIIGLMTLGKG
jgi:hypothetical protein